MDIIWHGHSCFEIVEDGYHVVIDPFEPTSCGDAYPVIKDLEADELLITHEHRDHCYRDGVKLRRGRISPFTITSMETYHDVMRGAVRGMNTVYFLEANGQTAVHLGDLGISLKGEQLERVKGCDVLMIPVGGIYTIEPEAAFYLVEKLMPRVVIPMHYQMPGHSNWRLRKLEYFSEIFLEQPILPVYEYDTNQIEVTKETESQVALLAPPKA